MMPVTTVGIAALFVLAKPVVNVLLGSAYAGSVPVLRLYLVGMVFASLNQPLADTSRASVMKASSPE